MTKALSTKYRKIYETLMRKAKSRGKPEGYFEEHHIEPRSVGGSNAPSNLVYLTAREHLLAHKLWLRFETNPKRKRKAQNAFWAMVTMRSKSNAGRIVPTSRDYETAKIAMIEARTGVPRTPETIAKVSESLKKHFAENGCHNKGRSYQHLPFQERSRIFGAGNRGRIQSQQEKDARAAKLRKPRSEKARENIRLGALKRESARREARAQAN